MRVFSPSTCKRAGLLSVLAVRRTANTCVVRIMGTLCAEKGTVGR